MLLACETGVVDTKSSENVSRLAKAFIQAGAEDVVMSLRKVSDSATQDLMSAFYKELHKRQYYSKTSKDAKLKMISQNKNYSYWTPFKVLGN
ncbi:hypothetical protein NitYY0918_C0392 [Nitratiruptor sp. YY09-18]|nr:hypothetical protein NitYY0918_C0392 [Nitratiruptor sp. YY09-18]